ncbi:hypothetical protein LHJ74_14770 [Streptomyces sp. N2-109]|uniref:Uncharacterized protein n=1 Tax=Streptomyces gossypii TaxID=2883101 RepID=A0ABT2JTE8_9ACTN|nr:hypothetical protein [Streptomyces gossypii]MCT2591155.1 hypothetical protein [Streptomyces gossypii]
MAWPEDRLDVVVEAYLSGAWRDITEHVYGHDRGEIAITRGRANESSSLEPSRVTATLNNRDGRYSPRNPNSPYYGGFGRNAPMLVWVRGLEPYLWIPDGGSRASVASGSALDLTTDLDVRIELSLDKNPTQSSTYAARVNEIAARYNTTGDQRSWRLLMNTLGQPQLGWSPDGVTVAPQLAADTLVPYASGARFTVRVTLDVDNGSGGHTARFFTAPTLAGPWTQLGDPVTGTGTTSIYNPADAALEIGDVTSLGFGTGAGRYYGMELRDGIGGTLLADPDFTAQTPGITSFTDDAGNLWELQGAALITDMYRRIRAEVPAWPTRWTTGGLDVWTEVEAAGITRRLGQGAAPLQSTLRRRIPSGLPLAYWPMEEGTDATVAYSPIEGVPAMHAPRMTWAADSSLPGSDALPTLGDSSLLYARVPRAAADGWHVELVYKLETLPTTRRTMLEVNLVGSTVSTVLVLIDSGQIRLELHDVDGTVLGAASLTDAGALADFVGVWNRLRIFTAVDPGSGDTYFHISWRDVITDISWYVRWPLSTDAGRVVSIDGDWGSDLNGMAIGHLAVFDIPGTFGAGHSVPNVSIYDSADEAFAGERTWHRLRRLAEEEDLPLIYSGDFYESQQVGPQQIDTVLTNVQAAADVDGGMLIEQRETLGMAYRARDTLYNQASALTLDYMVSGEIMPGLEPVDDDQALRNWVTVSRDGGSSADAVEEEGPLSIAPPPDGAGVYNEAVSVNAYTDEQLPQLAAWRLHLGTVDEARYPQVSVNLRTAPHLITQVMSLDVGDIITLTNLPPWLAPGDVRLRVEGYTEILNAFRWEITFNCSAASPWLVATLVEGTTVEEGFEDATLDVTIADAGDLPWARASDQAHTGTWSLKSGAITHGQTSDAVLELPPNADELVFWYRVSSEPNFDYLRVLLDGLERIKTSGEVGWTRAVVDVSGASTVTFRYSKDVGDTAGSDAAWIDDLTIAVPADAGADQPNRVDTTGSQLEREVTETGTQLVVHTPQDGQITRAVWVCSAGACASVEDLPLDVRVGGEVVRATAITPLAYDSFGRVVASGWGTADSGQTWVTTGTPADYAVNGSAGTITLTSAPSTTRFAQAPEELGGCEITVTITPSQLATGAEFLPAVLLRASGSLYYRCRLLLGTSGSVSLQVTQTTTVVATGTTTWTYGAGTALHMRVRIIGHRVMGRVWTDAAPEPCVWHVDATIASGLVEVGAVGVTGSAFSGNTNISPSFAYDGFEVVNPQAMTVTRSINGVTKSHTAGTSVELAQPAHVAL